MSRLIRPLTRVAVASLLLVCGCADASPLPSPTLRRKLPSAASIPPLVGHAIRVSSVVEDEQGAFPAGHYEALGKPFGQATYEFDPHKGAGLSALDVAIFSVADAKDALELQRSDAPWYRRDFADLDPYRSGRSQLESDIAHREVQIKAVGRGETWKAVCVSGLLGSNGCNGLVVTISWCQWYLEVLLNAPAWSPIDLQGDWVQQAPVELWRSIQPGLSCER